MDKDFINRGRIIRSSPSYRETMDLYRILQRNRVTRNILLEDIVSLLVLIDEYEIPTQDGKDISLPSFILDRLGVTENRILLILNFIVDERLVEPFNGLLKLTPSGRLFLISDEISSSMDLIKYYWEKSDWSRLFKSKGNGKYLQNASRRYLACLLSQLENCLIDIEKLKSKYGHIEDIYFNNIFVIKEMLNDSSMQDIIENIFEPMGLINVERNDNTKKFNLTARGKRVFEYYSQGMVDEYKELLEECWECYDRGNFQQALEMSRNIISVIGSMPDSYNVIGCVYIKLGNYEIAKDVFMLAMELCENRMGDVLNKGESLMEVYVSMYYNLGLCYFYMGYYLRALGIFASIKKTLPYDLDSLEEIMNSIKKIILI